VPIFQKRINRHYGFQLKISERHFWFIILWAGEKNTFPIHIPVNRSHLGTIRKNHIQSSSNFSQNCSFCMFWIWCVLWILVAKKR